MARIKVRLSQKSVDDTIKRLKDIKTELKNLNDDLPKQLAELTSDQIIKNYNLKGFYSSDKPTIGVVKYSNGSYKAFIRGHSVIYDEFGTGDVGASAGHPWKSAYGLNPYNSGPTIRPADEKSKEKYNITSGLYWTYYDEKKKSMVATQGVPAGMFMYKSAMWLRNNYKKIVKEKVDDVLSKL